MLDTAPFEPAALTLGHDVVDPRNDGPQHVRLVVDAEGTSHCSGATVT
jgi:hypothetical protein